MDKIIGIPRSLYFYYYNFFWRSFFNYLSIRTIISPKTNKEIIMKGTSIANDEMCLALKTYLGHIDYLKDKCDYILIPRIDNYGICNQSCTNFLSLYDIVNNLFDVKILNYNIDFEKGKTELKGLINIGKKLNRTKKEVIEAYYKAKNEEEIIKLKNIEDNVVKLYNNNIKVLIISHPYVIYDNYFGTSIISFLEKMNVSVIYANEFNSDITNKLAYKYSKTLYWKYSKELIGSIEIVKDKIDGIIFISSFPCGLDSLVNELTTRNINIPNINIIIDDIDSFTGIETRLESFIDVLESRKKNV